MPTLVDAIVDRFVVATETCRSIDCVLVKLSSAFFEIRGIVRDFPTTGSEKDLVNDFLNHPETLKVLAGLTNTIGAVENKVQSDPRFKDLRAYAPQIINAIKRASEMHTPRQVYYEHERPPLWRIEYEEQKTGEAKRYTSSIRVSLPRSDFSKWFLILYFVLLAITAYVFFGVPWLVLYGERFLIDSLKTTPVKISFSGWDVAWFFIELWRMFNIRPPIFIAYSIGLPLAVIALVARSYIISAVSGLAMLIGWYDFYKSATTTYLLYVQITSIFTDIKSAELEIGATIAGALALLHLILGTYLIYKTAT